MDVRAVEGPEAVRHYATLHNALNPDDRTDAEELGGWLDSLPEHAFFVAGEDEPIGVGWAALTHSRPLPEARILVLEEHRRRGLGTALYRAVSGWAAERGHRELEARVRETHPAGIEFAEHRGFVEVGRDQGLVLDLTTAAAPEVELPAGIEIVSWAERPDAAEGLYAVYCEAIPDVPGEEESEIEPYDVWMRVHMRGPTDDPRATFVAYERDEVVGFSKFALTKAEPTTAFHDLTGVRRAWRGRGIAGALKATQIRWAKERGYERLMTQNEERNAPIRRLNERFGYRLGTARLLLRGPIA